MADQGNVLKFASLVFTLVITTLMFIWILQNIDSIVRGLRGISFWQVGASFSSVALGLYFLRKIWSQVLSGFGCELSSQSAAKVFYVGQLGKYLPGSVWSVLAQATLARRYGIPIRTTFAAGILLVYLLLVSSLALLGLISAIYQFPIVQHLIFLPYILLGFAALGAHPRILASTAKWLARSLFTFARPWSETTKLFTYLVMFWLLFGISVTLLVPFQSGAPFLNSLITSTFYFTLAFVLGILVPFAPAGIGVREGILISGLSLEFGIEIAASTALLARLIHTVADLSFASYVSISN